MRVIVIALEHGSVGINTRSGLGWYAWQGVSGVFNVEGKVIRAWADKLPDGLAEALYAKGYSVY